MSDDKTSSPDTERSDVYGLPIVSETNSVPLQGREIETEGQSQARVRRLVVCIKTAVHWKYSEEGTSVSSRARVSHPGQGVQRSKD